MAKNYNLLAFQKLLLDQDQNISKMQSWVINREIKEMRDLING